MPKYRLVYFNMRGRAEPIRWMLALAKQPYEDERFDKDTEWSSRKDGNYWLPLINTSDD